MSPSVKVVTRVDRFASIHLVVKSHSFKIFYSFSLSPRMSVPLYLLSFFFPTENYPCSSLRSPYPRMVVIVKRTRFFTGGRGLTIQFERRTQFVSNRIKARTQIRIRTRAITAKLQVHHCSSCSVHAHANKVGKKQFFQAVTSEPTLMKRSCR